MKNKALLVSLTLALPLFTFTNTSHASNSLNKYTHCSESQVEMVKNLLNLTFDEAYFSGIHDYHRCLVIDPSKQTLLLANSNKIAIDKDEQGNEEVSTYNLTAYLIDGKGQKLLSKKVLTNEIGSDASHFDGIELDTTPFSTLPNTTVIGVLQKHSHNGSTSHGNDDLQLLNIDGTTITPIGAIATNVYSTTDWDDTCHSKAFYKEDIKTTLILSDKVHNGLQDIVVKSHKIKEDTTNTCQHTKKTWQKQQSVKFDGKMYNFPNIELGNDGI